eukprot:296184-Amphidinium_carterae.1
MREQVLKLLQEFSVHGLPERFKRREPFAHTQNNQTYKPAQLVQINGLLSSEGVESQLEQALIFARQRGLRHAAAMIMRFSHVSKQLPRSDSDIQKGLNNNSITSPGMIRV